MNINQTLKHYFGYDSLRKGQSELIEGILQGKDVLGIMPTGAGKSLCYQLPALMLEGTTIVVSPLISLMSDQVKALNQAGVHAAYINSSLTENQIRTALSYAAQGRYKIIYVAPERLNTPRFLEFACNGQISMLTVDEAHCISQWGQDFRPSYLEIEDFLVRLPKRPIVSAFTATATERVKNDIIKNLSLENPVTMVTGFDRPNLFFSVVARKGGRETDNSIINYVKKHEDESGIIYCATKKNVDNLHALLLRYGIQAGRYHAGMSLEERKKNQDDFTYDRIRVMVATNAFGMGIDKSNVRYVLHYNMPQSLEYYYQEAGRAGRDGEEAECVLFFSKQDIMINKRLLQYKVTQGEGGDDEEENYIQNGKTHKKALQLSGLSEVGQELFEKLRICRMKLASEKSVPPYIICSDKTLKDMCAKCPETKEKMAEVYGMGEQKIKSYGDVFIEEINKFIAEKSISQVIKVEDLTTEDVSPVSKSKKKQPFYIEPGKLDLVGLKDKCMISELTDSINALCPENKERKKLSAAFVNELLVKEGYLEEIEENGNKEKRVTEKGKAAGIEENERKSKYGGIYFAIVHTRLSQQMIIEMLKQYYSDAIIVDAGNEV